MAHICVSKLIIIGSDNSLSSGRNQAIMWINAEMLLIRTLETNFSEISEFIIFIQENAFENVVCEMVAALCQTQCVNVVIIMPANVPNFHR